VATVNASLRRTSSSKYDRAELTSAALAAHDRNAALVAHASGRIPSRQITVEGHCDEARLRRNTTSLSATVGLRVRPMSSRKIGPRTFCKS